LQNRCKKNRDIIIKKWEEQRRVIKDAEIRAKGYSDDDENHSSKEPIGYFQKDIATRGTPKSFGEALTRTGEIAQTIAEQKIKMRQKLFKKPLIGTFSFPKSDTVYKTFNPDPATDFDRERQEVNLWELEFADYQDPTTLEAKNSLKIAKGLLESYSPEMMDGQVKIYTKTNFNSPSIWRVPDEIDYKDVPHLEEILNKAGTFLNLEPMIPESGGEWVISLKLERFFSQIYPCKTPTERLEFAEEFDISPGEKTLDFVHSFPPPEHTYNEIPIMKENDEDETSAH